MNVASQMIIFDLKIQRIVEPHDDCATSILHSVTSNRQPLNFAKPRKDALTLAIFLRDSSRWLQRLQPRG